MEIIPNDNGEILARLTRRVFRSRSNYSEDAERTDEEGRAKLERKGEKLGGRWSEQSRLIKREGRVWFVAESFSPPAASCRTAPTESLILRPIELAVS